MIPVEEHLEDILSRVRPTREAWLPLERAYGLVTTQPLVSEVDLPRFDNSAMDGYAVRAADVEGIDAENPKNIKVQGDIPAGDTEPRVLEPGMAWRIMTGAPIPEGADAIVPVEDTDDRPRETQIRKGRIGCPHSARWWRPAGRRLDRPGWHNDWPFPGGCLGLGRRGVGARL
ncbi:hypothetical protein L0A91_16230 [Ornithinimicrobium sp. INDO-MA30-4]|nr:hypothetical protein [Ornithinimicrobium sp. INDO-MA30-4]UJH70568.1 hypothetical protein L0A91_16230 [Ornithinimicrobium sp. INDO-MA30-4]